MSTLLQDPLPVAFAPALAARADRRRRTLRGPPTAETSRRLGAGEPATLAHPLPLAPLSLADARKHWLP